MLLRHMLYSSIESFYQMKMKGEDPYIPEEFRHHLHKYLCGNYSV